MAFAERVRTPREGTRPTVSARRAPLTVGPVTSPGAPMTFTKRLLQQPLAKACCERTVRHAVCGTCSHAARGHAAYSFCTACTVDCRPGDLTGRANDLHQTTFATAFSWAVGAAGGIESAAAARRTPGRFARPQAMGAIRQRVWSDARPLEPQ